MGLAVESLHFGAEYREGQRIKAFTIKRGFLGQNRKFMKYNFDEIIDRSGTDSVKVDKMKALT